METIVASKGRIVIPTHIRRELGIKPGTHIHVELDAATKRIILTPIPRALMRSLRGKYKGLGLMKAFMAGKNGEWKKR